jgi:hypothetical protein
MLPYMDALPLGAPLSDADGVTDAHAEDVLDGRGEVLTRVLALTLTVGVQERVARAELDGDAVPGRSK